MFLFGTRPSCSLDKKKSNELQLNTFRPFSYSNVDHWYKWLWEKSDTMVPNVTQHRASLQPWISSSPSNLLKWLNIVVSKTPRTLAMIIKKRNLKDKSRKQCKRTLKILRRLSSRAEYSVNCLKVIRNTHAIPPVLKYRETNHPLEINNATCSMITSSAYSTLNFSKRLKSPFCAEFYIN